MQHKKRPDATAAKLRVHMQRKKIHNSCFANGRHSCCSCQKGEIRRHRNQHHMQADMPSCWSAKCISQLREVINGVEQYNSFILSRCQPSNKRCFTLSCCPALLAKHEPLHRIASQATSGASLFLVARHYWQIMNHCIVLPAKQQAVLHSFLLPGITGKA